MSENKNTALKEIHKSLEFCNFCTRMVGLSITDNLPTGIFAQFKRNFLFVISALSLIALVAAEVAYVVGLVIKTTSVAEFVESLHIVGYGAMSANKLFTIWYKRRVFSQLLVELEELWPVKPEDQQEDRIKKESLSALRLAQIWYTYFNVFGVLGYNLTPLVLHIYRKARGTPAVLGYVWHATYPFDKTKNIYHETVYAFEAFAGLVSVWSMLSSDMMFTTMASHISMLLRILQVKIRRLAITQGDSVNLSSDGKDYVDCYEDIVDVIKTHQRLIRYRNDLENTFGMVNLINVLLSSVNICCVVFVIVLLEPWMEINNKFFLLAALTQVGILCWYADDIYRASVGVADAAFESRWHATDTRCRRAILVLIQRSQKPLYFTALKFTPITMTTYSSIITNSYSYFTLLYTMYRSD